MAFNLTSFESPNGVINPSDFANCTVDTCPIVTSFYNYRIDLAPNVLFLILFSLAIPVYLGIWLRTRRGHFFAVVMVAGLVAEMIGYIGRIKSYQDQWDENGFLIQIVCLAFAPAFFSAGIYVCLGHIVILYGRENSRIPAEWYTRTFISCDAVSMLLQATGAGIASFELQSDESLQKGDDILTAGLVSQVFTLFIFMSLAVDFALRVRRRTRGLGDTAELAEDPRLVAVRRSWSFRGFLVALASATIAVFWRCVYRVAELNQGWMGPVTYKQGLFIGFEGVLMVFTVVVLCLFHPVLCMPIVMGPLKDDKSAKQNDVIGSDGILVDGNSSGNGNSQHTQEANRDPVRFEEVVEYSIGEKEEA